MALEAGTVFDPVWLVVTGTMEFYDCPFSWEFQHPNWLSVHDFSEG